MISHITCIVCCCSFTCFWHTPHTPPLFFPFDLFHSVVWRLGRFRPTDYRLYPNIYPFPHPNSDFFFSLLTSSQPIHTVICAQARHAGGGLTLGNGQVQIWSAWMDLNSLNHQPLIVRAMCWRSSFIVNLLLRRSSSIASARIYRSPWDRRAGNYFFQNNSISSLIITLHYRLPSLISEDAGSRSHSWTPQSLKHGIDLVGKMGRWKLVLLTKEVKGAWHPWYFCLAHKTQKSPIDALKDVEDRVEAKYDLDSINCHLLCKCPV